MSRWHSIVAALLAVLAASAVALLVREPPAAGPSDPTRPDLRGVAKLAACRYAADSAAEHSLPQPVDENCFVRIDGATFRMGAQSTDPFGPSYDPDASSDESPPHGVTLRGYWMLMDEVLVEQFAKCAAAGACKPDDVATGSGHFNHGILPARRLHPINGVTWFGADAYCKFIGGRLPTEAEWELAARGEKYRRYPWGPRRATCNDAVMDDGKAGGCGSDTTQDEWYGSMFGPSPRFLRHMAGNVWEWVADWYGPYDGASQDDPRGPAQGERRVQRGGGWTTQVAAELRASYRAALEPTLRLEDVGFRCAADAVTDQETLDREASRAALDRYQGPDSPYRGRWQLVHTGEKPGTEETLGLIIQRDGSLWLEDQKRAEPFGKILPDGTLELQDGASGRCASLDACAGQFPLGQWSMKRAR